MKTQRLMLGLRMDINERMIIGRSDLMSKQTL